MPAYARIAAESTSSLLPATSRAQRRIAEQGEIAAMKADRSLWFDDAPVQVTRYVDGRYHLRVLVRATPRLLVDHHIIYACRSRDVEAIEHLKKAG